VLTKTHLTQRDLSSKEDTSSGGKDFSMFLLGSEQFCRIKSTRFLTSLQHFVSSNISNLFSSLILAPHSVSFSLILSVKVRIFSFFPSIPFLRMIKAWEMPAMKATLLHQVSSLSRSAYPDFSGMKNIISSSFSS
jgi:hypothetical protein